MTRGSRWIVPGAPSAIFEPKLSTVTTRESFITSDILCSIKRIVTPRRSTSAISDSSSIVSCVFIPADGSSRSRSLGSLASARATSRRRCSPYGSSTAGRIALPTRPTSSRISAARRRALASAGGRRKGTPSSGDKRPPRVRQWSPSWTFSSTVIEPKSRMFWKVRQMPSAVRRYDASSPISRPAKRMCPASGPRAPVTRLKNVVLPAPFGPMIAWTPPASTARSSFERTTSFPKLRESPSTASSGTLTAQRDPGQQGRVEQSLRPHEHQGQDEQAVEDLAPVFYPAQELRQHRKDRGPDDGAPEARETAKDRVEHHEERAPDAEGLRIDEECVVGVERAAEPGDHAARREGRQLHVGRVHAHRLGRRLVVAQRRERAAHARACEPHEEVDEDDQEAEHVPEGRRRRDAGEARGPAEGRRGQEQDADHPAEPAGAEHQVEPAQTQGGEAHRETDEPADEPAGRERQRERRPVLHGKVRRRVRAERHEAALTRRELACRGRQVERQRHDHVDAGEDEDRDGVVREHAPLSRLEGARRRGRSGARAESGSSQRTRTRPGRTRRDRPRSSPRRRR